MCGNCSLWCAPLDDPQVSVIIPCHNYGHLIGLALDSLRAQTLVAWECVVVDDGSSDDTARVVAAYAAQDARIRYVFQERQGPSAARNRALQATCAPYVQFLDADDLLQPQKLAFQAAFLNACPDIDIFHGNVLLFTEETLAERLALPWQRIEANEHTLEGAGLEALGQLIERNVLFINAVLLRRSVIDRIGLFDENLGAVEDWDFWLRCALSGARFAYQDAPETRALVRFHPSSFSTDRRRTLTAVLQIRDGLAVQLADPLMQKLNHTQQQEEQAALWLQEGMNGRMGAAMIALVQGAVRQRCLRWLGYAFALPLARFPWGRRMIHKLRRRGRGEA